MRSGAVVRSRICRRRAESENSRVRETCPRFPALESRQRGENDGVWRTIMAGEFMAIGSRGLRMWRAGAEIEDLCMRAWSALTLAPGEYWCWCWYCCRLEKRKDRQIMVVMSPLLKTRLAWCSCPALDAERPRETGVVHSKLPTIPRVPLPKCGPSVELGSRPGRLEKPGPRAAWTKCPESLVCGTHYRMSRPAVGEAPEAREAPGGSLDEPGMVPVCQSHVIAS